MVYRLYNQFGLELMLELPVLTLTLILSICVIQAKLLTRMWLNLKELVIMMVLSMNLRLSNSIAITIKIILKYQIGLWNMEVVLLKTKIFGLVFTHIQMQMFKYTQVSILVIVKKGILK